ncbi:MAG: bifunctional phosphoribosylaminoimidazolecarboxamide formyltransferase/IMP cyclohydrolase [Spirochaetes bacterium]|nr:bifunctional phosphoribosylaminoimidazolecarboxamide formyltransferase/IMP cyclohydrolase [Spirochaetota bacterium]
MSLGCDNKKYALISVFDKNNVEKIVEFLIKKKYEIISTGGTLKYLREKGFSPIEISDYTGFPEILDGRVKTLHPKVHAGILSLRDKMEHMETNKNYNIPYIDFVVVNLYPFFEKVNSDLSFNEKIEFIDIGGPTLLRAAAKNFKDVVVLSDPKDYELVIDEFERKESISYETRKYLAFKVFNMISSYDACISNFLYDKSYGFPEYLSLSYKKDFDLRYGENPHQKASFYIDSYYDGFFKNFEKLHGKELSYNNIKDIDAAWKIACEFENPVAVGVKHNVPCFVAVADNLYNAYLKGLRCDDISIFGGIVAFNGKVCSDLAKKLNEIFLEIIIANDFSDEALYILKKKKNLRIIKIKDNKIKQKYDFSPVDGGILLQEYDNFLFEGFNVVTSKVPDNYLKDQMIFAYKVVKYCKSNAIVVTTDFATSGIAGGQVNRIWAAKQALSRAKDRFNQIDVLASDGFFPFPDVVEEALKYGVKAIIQPGGSIKDNESIELAEKNNIIMVITNTRHFKH